MPSPYATPSTFKAPVAPHPTPLSTSSFLTHSKAPLNGNTLGAKNLKQPIYNPYDKFTQNDFDAWIGNITGALRRALGEEEEEKPEPPEPATATSERELAASVSGSPSNEGDENSEWDGVEDSFAEIKARRVVGSGKGKQRDPLEGPGLRGDNGGPDSPIEIDSGSEEEVEEQEQGISEDEADEDEVGRAVSIDRWEDTVREAARHRREAIAEEHEDAGEELEDYGGEYDEDGWNEDELEESAVRGGPQEIIDLGSDDEDEVDLRSSPVRHSAEAEGEEEEEEEGEEYDDNEEGEEEGEEEQPYSADARVRIGPPIGRPRHRVVAEAPALSDQEDGDEDEDFVEVIELNDDEDDMQPESAEADNDVFPPRSLRAQVDQPIIVDPWEASRNYAEDFYAGGDSLNIPAGVSPRAAAHLLGSEVDETPFLTPGVVTPYEGDASPYSPPREVDDNNNGEIQEIAPLTQDEAPPFEFPTSLERFEETSIDPILRNPTPQTSPMDISMEVDESTPQIQPSQKLAEAADIEFSIFAPTSAGIDSNPYPDAQQVLDILSAFVDASNMDTSDMSSVFHQDNEAFVTDHNTSSEDQGRSEADGLDGQHGTVIDVDIDIVSIPDKDYQERGDVEQGFIEESVSDVGFDDQPQTFHIRDSSVDIFNVAYDEPVAGPSIFGIVDEEESPLDEEMDVHMVDDSLMHVNEDEPIEQTVDQPFEQAITPPATPKASISDSPPKDKFQDTLHTSPPRTTEYPMPVSADPNVSDPIDSNATKDQTTTPPRPSIVSMPGTPIYVLSPVGTPGGQPTPVSVPVSRAVLKVLQKMSSGPATPVNGLFTPAVTSPRAPSSPNPSQLPDDNTLDEAVIKDVATNGDLGVLPEADQDVQLAHDHVEMAELPTSQPTDGAGDADDADGVVLGQTRVPSSPLKHLYLDKPKTPEPLQDYAPDIPSRPHLAGPGVPPPAPPLTMVLIPPRKPSGPYRYMDPYPYSLSTPGFPTSLDYGKMNIIPPVPRQDNAPVILPSVAQRADQVPVATTILLLKPSNQRDDLLNNPSMGAQLADEVPAVTANPQQDDILVIPPSDALRAGPDEPPEPESPKPMVMTRQKSTDPVLYADPYPYSLSTPGFEVVTPGSEEDTDELDISMESISSGTKSSDEKGEDVVDDPMDDIVLRYPSEPKDPEVLSDTILAPTESAVKPEDEEVVQDRSRSATPPIEMPQPADEVLRTDVDDSKPESTETVTDDTLPGVEIGEPASAENSAAREPTDELPDKPASPKTKERSPDPSELDHKRKRSSGSPLSDTESSKPASLSAQAKGKGKAPNPRPEIDIGPDLRRASSIASASSDSMLIPPSPTTLKEQPFVVPPPLFLAHSHSKIKPNAITNANAGKNAQPKPGPSTNTPSKLLAQRTLLSFISSPRTRSNCRFHKISLPREEGGPRVCFLVPGCSLGDQELMEEEEIVDHGDATIEDSKHMVAVSETADDFSLDLIGILRQLVGVDLLREHEVYYCNLPLPSPSERPRFQTSHNRLPSDYSFTSSTRTPISVARSSTSIPSTSASKKPESDASSLSSLSTRSLSSVEGDRGTKRRRPPPDNDAEGSTLDTEITIQVRRKPLKAARRNRRVDTEQSPPAEEEENDTPDTQIENRRVTRSLKRSRTMGHEDASKSNKTSKKRRLQTQLTS